MQSNTAVRRTPVRTAGGSPAYAHLAPLQQLRRLVLSCLLWEDEFYVDGKSIAQAIVDASAHVPANVVADLAIEARTAQHLRHVPLLLVLALAKRGGPEVSRALAGVLLRADELNEFVSLYWANGKTPLSKQIKKGLAKAFQKFDAYQLAKYDREKAVRLRDVLFMVHAKPKDEVQAGIWKQLIDGTLPAPDTWEFGLSTGGDKRATFERLITEGKLGYFALLRNLRNIVISGVPDDIVRDAILARRGGAERVLPFRYIAAARACPRFEPALDESLSHCIDGLPILPGLTVVMVDISPSMDAPLSAKSDLTRKDAAAALASLVHGNVRMFSFSNDVVEVPPRRGMAGVDALLKSQRPNGTRLFDAIAKVSATVKYNRLIVITDEQDTGGDVRTCPNPTPGARGYMVNVASNRNGVGYGPHWTHIDGFSENVLRWIAEVENAG